jgi:hypothetical protein
MESNNNWFTINNEGHDSYGKIISHPSYAAALAYARGTHCTTKSANRIAPGYYLLQDTYITDRKTAEAHLDITLPEIFPSAGFHIIRGELSAR